MVQWISHRGESYDAPENTLAAFRLAAARRTDGSECDVHLTRDGRLVVAHDSNTWRMGDRALEIESSTYEELQTVNVAGGFGLSIPTARIPLLQETLAELGGGRTLYIELKGADPELVRALARELEHTEIPPEFIVLIAFDRNLLKLAKTVMPQFQTLWLTNLNTAQGTRMAPEELLGILNSIQADGVDAAASPAIDRALVDMLHGAGKWFAVWTVDHPGMARAMIECGVDAITSNRAADLRTLVEKNQH